MITAKRDPVSGTEKKKENDNQKTNRRFNALKRSILKKIEVFYTGNRILNKLDALQRVKRVNRRFNALKRSILKKIEVFYTGNRMLNKLDALQRVKAL